MTESLAQWLSDERSRLWVFAASASLIVVLAMVDTDNVAAWSILPWVAAAFVAKATWPNEISLWLVAAASLIGSYVVAIIDNDTETAMFLHILAVAAIASSDSDRDRVTAFVAGSLVLLATLNITGAMNIGWVNWVVGSVFAWGFGAVAYKYLIVIEELESTRSRMVDQAALQERRRIARDVHDLVGHSLSVVLLHITGARHLVHRDPDEAAEALAQAEHAGRASLAEIRRTIGLLRDESESVSHADPSPELRDIEAIVSQYRSAGMDIDYSVTGPIDEVEGARAVAGYRITQEALSNVSKHTVGASVAVTVRVDNDVCEVAVSNSGGRTIRSDGDSGFGLVGMRERVMSVGGSLVAGPTRDGWSVEVTFPRATPTNGSTA